MKEERDAETDESLCALHQAPLGRIAQRLGLCPLVGDRVAHAQEGHREDRELWVVPGTGEEVPRQTTKDEHIRDAIGHGVEEGAALRRRSRGLGNSAVEGVHEAADGEKHDCDVEIAESYEGTGRDRQENADDRHLVGLDA